MRIVIALGGNALLQPGETQEEEVLLKNINIAAKAIAPLAREHTVIICHGNGPQVGLLALQAEAYDKVRPYTLDVLCAESQGMIGYLLEQALRNVLSDASVVALLTQVVVNPNDPAFNFPTKPIGPYYTQKEAKGYASKKGWTFTKEEGFWRRVVSSPAPQEIVELPVIKTLLDAGNLVICGGGGGIAVSRTLQGTLEGVESIIDKDLMAAVLAISLQSDRLIILTNVDAVYKNWRTPQAEAIRYITPAGLRIMDFPSGSMGPKIQAACQFVNATHQTAIIGSLEDAEALLKEESGTVICEGIMRAGA